MVIGLKRKVASRKLKRTCIGCNKSFVKGDVHYVERKVFAEFGEIIAVEYVYCAKCKYHDENHVRRFKEFKKSGSCRHPVRDLVWQIIFGEDYAMEPSHEECLICGEVV